MHRKWKGVAALGMAALIGCLMPMGTMMAAEDDQEAVQEVEAGSESDAADNDEGILDDNENAGEEEDAVTDENVDDEINADDEIADDEVSVDDENVEDGVDADDVIADDEVDSDNDGNDGIEVMAEAEAGDEEVQAAPVINITLQGQSYAHGLGGEISYKYVNNLDPAFVCSASQDGQTVSLSYYLEKITTTNAEAKGEGQMNLEWVDAQSSPMTVRFSGDGRYVLYVKAVGADGQTTYARSGGIVVDTVAPDLTNLVNGGTYPEGKAFWVSEAYLESVTVNGNSVTPALDGSYQVIANGSSCVIKLKDKAGNEKIYEVNVSKTLADDGVISANGIYSLKPGISYNLGEGQWQVGGDKSVYSGGNTFYVGISGDYSFTKR